MLLAQRKRPRTPERKSAFGAIRTKVCGITRVGCYSGLRIPGGYTSEPPKPRVSLRGRLRAVNLGCAVMVAGTFRQHFVRDGVPDVPPWDYCPRSAREAKRTELAASAYTIQGCAAPDWGRGKICADFTPAERQSGFPFGVWGTFFGQGQRKSPRNN